MDASVSIETAPAVAGDTVRSELPDIPVGFSRAASALRKIRPVRCADAFTALTNLESLLHMAQILRELAPGELDQHFPAAGWLKDDSAVEGIGLAVVEAIGEIAPLDEMVEQNLLDEGTIRLVPASMGVPMNWDEWSEMTDSPDSYLSASMAPWALCSALNLGDEAAFDRFAEYFEWDLSYPRRAGNQLDFKKMVKALKRRGLGCFEAAWNIAMYDTGNLYFDYNVYEDNLPLPPLTIAGVRELERQYQEAQPIAADYREACRLFAENDDIPAAIVRIYARSLVKEEQKPKTLAEVFREERARGYVAENNATDPLGVLDREDEEEDGYPDDTL